MTKSVGKMKKSSIQKQRFYFITLKFFPQYNIEKSLLKGKILKYYFPASGDQFQAASFRLHAATWSLRLAACDLKPVACGLRPAACNPQPELKVFPIHHICDKILFNIYATLRNFT